MEPVKRVLCIHDLSCVGRCSLSVIVPVLSAMGVQACPMPTALMSTHTGGLGDPAVLHTESFCRNALRHWKELDLHFDCIYSGYLANTASAELVREAFAQNPQACKLVDPVLADHGSLYRAVTPELCETMRSLCRMADVICPNVTESAVLLGMLPDDRPFSNMSELSERLTGLHTAFPQAKAVVITGVQLSNGIHANALLEKNGAPKLLPFAPVAQQYPGTGDLFAAVLAGALTTGLGACDSAELAANFVAKAAAETFSVHADPRFGALFEPVLGYLTNQKKDDLSCQL
ncbi:pyridoxamine kinase [uncultured Ruthenibacterium sp.]|uniref:pyridoxamine kinase n=1 Tax=uncultured Ruthenibacterium sp. TaxID=1905347 RepID=UPI00349EA386